MAASWLCTSRGTEVRSRRVADSNARSARRRRSCRWKRRVGVVVDAGDGELSRATANVHGDAGLGRQVGPAPTDDVVLQRAGAAVVGDRAVLEPDAATVREEQLVERAQLVLAAMDVRPAGRLADVRVGLERRRGGLRVTGRERTLVFADDVEVGLVDVGVWLQQRRADGVASGQWPGAEVDAQLDDARVVVTVGGNGHRQLDASLVAVEGQ